MAKKQNNNIETEEILETKSQEDPVISEEPKKVQNEGKKLFSSKEPGTRLN